MAGEFWLSDQAWTSIEPLLPKNPPGVRRVDDRRVISGIVHVLKSGCRWKDCPAVYAPPTTIYNRFNRWSRRGLPDLVAGRSEPVDGQDGGALPPVRRLPTESRRFSTPNYRGPIICSGRTTRSKVSASTKPSAIASSRRVVPFLCAVLATVVALS